MSDIPQLSLGTAALVIFTMCAGFVMLRGMTRMLIGTLVLALSAWLAFLVWQTAPMLSVEWTGRSLAAITLGLPVLVFLAAFIVIRKVLKTVANPFGSADPPKPATPATTSRLVFRLLFSLIPATLLCLIGATVIHHTGSVAEVRAYAEKSLGITESTPARYFQDLKGVVQSSLPASLLEFLDPLADPARIALAKAITDQSSEVPAPAIDPATGKPIPRAIIVDDPELTGLARKGRYGDLLRHPVLSKHATP
jgi:hypothetical protein